MATRELRLLHPSPDQMLLLCDIYGSHVEPMFKLMHMPTLRKLVSSASSNIHEIPFGNYVEPLLFSMYYAAITALTPEECLQFFQDGRESLLAKYRSGAETALANADLMNTIELGTIQALAIFLVSTSTPTSFHLCVTFDTSGIDHFYECSIFRLRMLIYEARWPFARMMIPSSLGLWSALLFALANQWAFTGKIPNLDYRHSQQKSVAGSGGS